MFKKIFGKFKNFTYLCDMKNKILLILIKRLLKEKDHIIDALCRQGTWEKMKFSDWARGKESTISIPYKTLEERFEDERKIQIEYSHDLYVEYLHKSEVLQNVISSIEKL